MSAIQTSMSPVFSSWRHSYKIVLTLFLVVAFLVWKFAIKNNEEVEKYITASVERANLQNLVTATGILQPQDYVDVGAQVSGQLKKLHVVVGSEVAAGDLLADIDATVYRAKVDGIRAQLRNLQAQLLDKQAQLTLANIRFERQQNLQKEDATTKETVQIAEASLLSAQALLQSLQAQIQQTESSLRSEEANLSYARIYAPIRGTVVSITSRQGQTLNTNQQAPTIMRIADLSSMTVQTQVSEADIGKLAVNMPVYFTTLGGKNYRWYGTLNRIEPTPVVSNNVVLYNALFDVPNENRVLMTQMSAQVFFVAASAKDALVIPASAVNFQRQKSAYGNENNTKQHAAKALKISPTEKIKSVDKSEAENFDEVATSAVVQVMEKNGKISERKISLGIGNRVQVQVLDGLIEGEIVVSGFRQIEKSNMPASAMGSNSDMSGAKASRMMR